MKMHYLCKKWPSTQRLSADVQLKKTIVEGPYYLFCSVNGYLSPHYSTGVAHSSCIVTKPYEKQEFSKKDVFIPQWFEYIKTQTLLAPSNGLVVSVEMIGGLFVFPGDGAMFEIILMAGFTSLSDDILEHLLSQVPAPKYWLLWLICLIMYIENEERYWEEIEWKSFSLNRRQHIQTWKKIKNVRKQELMMMKFPHFF